MKKTTQHGIILLSCAMLWATVANFAIHYLVHWMQSMSDEMWYKAAFACWIFGAAIVAALSFIVLIIAGVSKFAP